MGIFIRAVVVSCSSCVWRTSEPSWHRAVRHSGWRNVTCLRLLTSSTCGTLERWAPFRFEIPIKSYNHTFEDSIVVVIFFFHDGIFAEFILLCGIAKACSSGIFILISSRKKRFEGLSVCFLTLMLQLYLSIYQCTNN